MKKILGWLCKIFSVFFVRNKGKSNEKVSIIDEIYKLSKQGRVNIYLGSVAGLRKAQSNPTSFVYVVEIKNPPTTKEKISFSRYVRKLKDMF
jgi:hypothetical protein